MAVGIVLDFEGATLDQFTADVAITPPTVTFYEVCNSFTK